MGAIPSTSSNAWGPERSLEPFQHGVGGKALIEDAHPSVTASRERELPRQTLKRNSITSPSWTT